MTIGSNCNRAKKTKTTGDVQCMEDVISESITLSLLQQSVVIRSVLLDGHCNEPHYTSHHFILLSVCLGYKLKKEKKQNCRKHSLGLVYPVCQSLVQIVKGWGKIMVALWSRRVYTARWMAAY